MINYENFGAYNCTLMGRFGRSTESVYFDGRRAEPKDFDWTFPTSTAATETKNPLPFGTDYLGSGSSTPEAQGTGAPNLEIGFPVVTRGRARDSAGMAVDFVTAAVARAKAATRASLAADYVLTGRASGQARDVAALAVDYAMVAVARCLANLVGAMDMIPGSTPVDLAGSARGRALDIGAMTTDMALAAAARGLASVAAGMAEDVALGGSLTARARDQGQLTEDLNLAARSVAVAATIAMFEAGPTTTHLLTAVTRGIASAAARMAADMALSGRPAGQARDVGAMAMDLALSVRPTGRARDQVTFGLTLLGGGLSQGVAEGSAVMANLFGPFLLYPPFTAKVTPTASSVLTSGTVSEARVTSTQALARFIDTVARAVVPSTLTQARLN